LVRGLKVNVKPKRRFVSQIGIFTVVDRVSEGKIEASVQPGEGFGPDARPERFFMEIDSAILFHVDGVSAVEKGPSPSGDEKTQPDFLVSQGVAEIIYSSILERWPNVYNVVVHRKKGITYACAEGSGYLSGGKIPGKPQSPRGSGCSQARMSGGALSG